MICPRISVIVPVYNTEKYLRKCVDSILAQTFSDFELLLVNDGSTDRSGDICEDYAATDQRVRVIHKTNGGVSYARNIGLDCAHGEWICYIDADDWIKQDYLEKLKFKADTSCADIVTCNFYFACHDKITSGRAYSWKHQGIVGLEKYIASTWTTLWGSIHRKSLYIAGGLRCPENISYCEDFHLMIRLISVASKVANVDEPLYYYRQRNTSIIHNLGRGAMYDEIWVYTDIIEYFKQMGIYEHLKELWLGEL